MLRGNEKVSETDILHLDFMEIKKNLPANIKMINCTLAELTENCKVITREVFKFFNLEEI